MSEVEREGGQVEDEDLALRVARLTRERDCKKLTAESAELDAAAGVVNDRKNRALRIEVANSTLALEAAKLDFATKQLRPAANEPWLIVGFALFGIVLGFATGITKTAGASQSLVTGIFAFVGGSLLSYSGFRRFAADTAVAPSRVGQGLAGFSCGVLLGVIVGANVRVEPPASDPKANAPKAATAAIAPNKAAAEESAAAKPSSAPAASVTATATTPTAVAAASGPQVVKQPCPPSSAEPEKKGFFLNADESATCSNVAAHMPGGTYADSTDAQGDARLLYKLFCSRPKGK